MSKFKFNMGDALKITKHLLPPYIHDDYGRVGIVIDRTLLYSFEELDNGEEIEHEHNGYMLELENGEHSNWYQSEEELEFVMSAKEYKRRKVIEELNKVSASQVQWYDAESDTYKGFESNRASEIEVGIIKDTGAFFSNVALPFEIIRLILDYFEV